MWFSSTGVSVCGGVVVAVEVVSAGSVQWWQRKEESYKQISIELRRPFTLGLLHPFLMHADVPTNWCRCASCVLQCAHDCFALFCMGKSCVTRNSDQSALHFGMSAQTSFMSLPLAHPACPRCPAAGFPSYLSLPQSVPFPFHSTSVHHSWLHSPLRFWAVLLVPVAFHSQRLAVRTVLPPPFPHGSRKLRGPRRCRQYQAVCRPPPSPTSPLN